MPLPTEPRSGGHRRKVAGPPGYFCRPFDAALDEGLTQIPDIGRRGLRERRDEPGVRRLHGHSSRIVVTARSIRQEASMANPGVKLFAQSFAQAAEKRKVLAMANALAESRRNSLAVRMPEVENVADDKVYTVLDISLKVWDVLNGLLEIAATVKAAAGAWSAATVSAEAIAASEAAAQAAVTV